MGGVGELIFEEITPIQRNGSQDIPLHMFLPDPTAHIEQEIDNEIRKVTSIWRGERLIFKINEKANSERRNWMNLTNIYFKMLRLCPRDENLLELMDDSFHQMERWTAFLVHFSNSK